MTTVDPVIVAKELRKQYEDITAVDGISFEVRRGEVFGMLGPNGAGKTTMMDIITGKTKPDSGSVFLSRKFINVTEI